MFPPLVVEYATREEALNAIEQVNDSELKGRMVHCREDRTLEESGLAADATMNSSPRVSKSDAPKVVDDTKVFVMNLSWETGSEDLKSYFGTVGIVTMAEVLRSKTGRSLGVGFVEFSDPNSVQAAIDQMNNQELMGRTITVREYYQ